MHNDDGLRARGGEKEASVPLGPCLDGGAAAEPGRDEDVEHAAPPPQAAPLMEQGQGTGGDSTSYGGTRGEETNKIASCAEAVSKQGIHVARNVTFIVKSRLRLPPFLAQS